MRCCFVFLISLWAFAAVGQTQKKNKSVTLFTVAGKPTSTDEFIYLFKKNHPKKEDYTPAKIDDYITLYTNFKLKVKEAHQLGLDTTTAFTKELKTYRDEIKRPFRSDKDVLDMLTHEAYDHLTQEVKAAHILIQVKPTDPPEDTVKAYNKILSIKKRAEAGEDFGTLAKELSEDPSAKNNAGNLGYFTALQMVYPFEKAAYQTKVGGVSPIIRTRFGYHLVRVDDKQNSRGEIEVSHILLRTTPDNDQKVKNQIFEIYDQLKTGRSWDELCKEYSEDSNTKNSGGRLRPFGIGALGSVPEFETNAFALQNLGDISDPFQSNVGWHIIRLEKKIPLPPYAEVESSLKKRISRDERLKIAEQAAVINRRKNFAFTENVENKNKIMALADSGLSKGKWKFTGNPDVKNLPLFLVSGKAVIASDFFGWIKQQQTASPLRPAMYMNQLYETFVDEKVNDAEDEKIIKENPDFQYLFTEYREGILLFNVMEKEVWNKALEDTVGQRKYYKSHLAQYHAGERVDARIFSTTDHSFFEEVKKKINHGDSITATDMKKFKSIQNSHNYEKGENKVIDKIKRRPGIQETELNGTYYFVDIKKLVQPGTKTFGEAHAQVISDYQELVEKNWMEKLRSKYPVEVNAKGKKLAVKELAKK